MKATHERRFDGEWQIKIAKRLWKMQRAKHIPCIWIEGDTVYIQNGFDSRMQISWTAAYRVTQGEPLLDVVITTSWLDEFVRKQKVKRKAA